MQPQRPHRGGRGRRLLAGGVAAVLLFVVGLALGRDSTPAPEPDPHPQPAPDEPDTPTENPQPEVEAGVPTGHPRTRRGAVTAAATYLQALGEAAPRSRRLERLAAAIALPQAVEAVARQRRLPADLATAGAGRALVSRVVPAGFRLDRFSRDEAVVAVWAIAVVTGPEELAALPDAPLRQSWGTARVVLRWTEGRWRLAALEDRSGPAPPGLAEQLREFDPFLAQPWPGEGPP